MKRKSRINLDKFNNNQIKQIHRMLDKKLKPVVGCAMDLVKILLERYEHLKGKNK